MYGLWLGAYAFYQTLFISLSREPSRLEISAFYHIVGEKD